MQNYRSRTPRKADYLVYPERMACAPCDPPTKKCTDSNDFFFSRGPGTFRVATSLHAEARAALVSRMGPSPGLVVLRGGLSACRNDSDHELLFRQESYFAYLFGVDEPDWWGDMANVAWLD